MNKVQCSMNGELEKLISIQVKKNKNFIQRNIFSSNNSY